MLFADVIHVISGVLSIQEVLERGWLLIIDLLSRHSAKRVSINLALSLFHSLGVDLLEHVTDARDLTVLLNDSLLQFVNSRCHQLFNLFLKLRLNNFKQLLCLGLLLLQIANFVLVDEFDEV